MSNAAAEPLTDETHVHTEEDAARLAEIPADGQGVMLTTAGVEGSGLERVVTLREAAELCDSTYTAMRKRADRGGLRTVKRGNVRMVPVSELERAGLLPDSELRAAQARVAELEAEVARHRLLTERAQSAAEAEQEARERAEAAIHEHRAAAEVAAARLEARELELARVAGAARGPLGPVKAWLAARSLAPAARDGSPVA